MSRPQENSDGLASAAEITAPVARAASFASTAFSASAVSAAPPAAPSQAAASTVPATVPGPKELAARVLGLAGPAVGEQLLFTAVQIAALAMVSHLGAQAIAAVGVSNSINWFFSSGFSAFGVGTTALVAHFVGAGDQRGAELAARQGVTVSFLLSFAVAALGFITAPAILSFMGAEDNVLAPAVVYLRLLFVASVFANLNLCFSAAMRGAGDTRTPMKIAFAGALVNVGIIWLLVYGRFGLPELDVAGAGLAILVAGVVTSSVYLFTLTSGRFALRLRWPGRRLSLDAAMVRRLLVIGVPSALEQLLMSGGMNAFARLIISLGTAAYAAHQVATNITSVSFTTGFGFSLAASTLVGQSLGAKRPDLAEAYALMARRLGLLVMCGLSVCFFFFGSSLMRIYTTDAAIIAMGVLILRLAAFAQPAIGSYSILAGALRGAGDTRYPLYITFVGMWTLRVGAAYLMVLAFGLGLTGVWLAVNLDQWVRMFLVLRRIGTGKWKEIKV